MSSTGCVTDEETYQTEKYSCWKEINQVIGFEVDGDRNSPNFPMNYLNQARLGGLSDLGIVHIKIIWNDESDRLFEMTGERFFSPSLKDTLRNLNSNEWRI